MLLTKTKLIFPSATFNKIVFIQVFFLFFSGIILDSNSTFQVALTLGLSWVILLLVLNTLPLVFFLKNFIRLNILVGILSVVGTILFALGYLRLYGIYAYQGNFNIYNYGLFFVKRTNELTYQLRPAGYYDEPGNFAFVVMFLLLLNRKYFKNLKWEYALLILPLVSTSLAHIFTIIIFAFLFYFNKKHVAKLSFSIVTIFSLFFIINSFSNSESIEYFNQRTFERFERVIEGGDDASRQGGLELGPKIFAEHHWGYSKEKVEQNYPDFVNETFWGPIIYYGIFGAFFYFLPFIYVGIKSIINKDKNQLLILLMVAINLLQRPYYMYPLFIILIYILFFQKERQSGWNEKEFFSTSQ